MKGRTRWFPRHVEPVRNGVYECQVRQAGMPGRLVRHHLEWDGKGFIVPFPMVVRRWRGLTKEGLRAAQLQADVEALISASKFRPVNWSDLNQPGAPIIGWGIERKGPNDRFYKPVGYKGELHPFKTKAEAMAKCRELMAKGQGVSSK